MNRKKKIYVKLPILIKIFNFSEKNLKKNEETLIL